MTSIGLPGLTVSIAALGVSAAHAQEDVYKDEIVVTASPIARSSDETIVGATLLSGDDLDRNLDGSIGETLRRQPGISSTFFGPAASQPVIRGLGGDRISILDSGIGSIDASSTSPDHAVAVEPATAERIEIVRGAATLLYGSSAAGGVVNVFSGRIPKRMPEAGVDGAMRIGASSVDDGVEAAGGFDVGRGKDQSSGFVFHGEGFYRRAHDYEIPGFAESWRLRAAEGGGDGPFGHVDNTALETRGGSAGLSYLGENGFAGLSASAINTEYGVPGHDHAGEEGGVTIALRQRRVDFDSEVDKDFLVFQKAKLRVGYADYTHSEIEPTGEVGTVFSNEGVEGRLELVEKQSPIGAGELHGATGVQWKLRDFSAIGEEAFVPPSNSLQLGVFTLKEYEVGHWRFEAGGRYEHTEHKSPVVAAPISFNAWSVSAGIGFQPSDIVFLGLTGLRTERAPSTEELFSNGPHLATGVFEIGDVSLGKEAARGLEATAKIGDEAISLTINGFYTSYRDFIFENDTGATVDVNNELLPVLQFAATDATFKGFEAQLDAELFHIGAFHIHLHGAGDYVRATAKNSPTGNLPRIPPATALIALETNSAYFDLRGELDHALAQNRTGAGELPTDSYSVYNLYATIKPMGEDSPVSLRIAAMNLTNDDARLHTSFLKDIAPLPGRNFKISVQGKF